MRDLIFSRKVSIKPDRVVIFNEVLRPLPDTGELVSLQYRGGKSSINQLSSDTKNVITRKFHNFNISAGGQKKIKEKITWLYTLAKSRYTKTYSGVEIHNFKIGFLTLTLPSLQRHSTAQITNECFNQFLTEIRQRTGMENYVWRLEFQRNGNVHYHIVTDVYIDYFFAQKVWNRIINKLGYVDIYKKKFSAMTLAQYVKSQTSDKCSDFSILAKRYAKGVACGWSEPRSVDVVSCSSGKQIANYISKYFGKLEKSGTSCNVLDNEENSFGLRLWFCSRSLSKLTSICEYESNLKIDWVSLVRGAKDVREVIADYAHCFFFSLSQMSNFAKSLFYPAFREYATLNNYNSA